MYKLEGQKHEEMFAVVYKNEYKMTIQEVIQAKKKPHFNRNTDCKVVVGFKMTVSVLP